MNKCRNLYSPLVALVNDPEKLHTLAPARVKRLFKRVKKLAGRERELACAIMLTFGKLSHEDVPEWAHAAARRWHSNAGNKMINLENMTGELLRNQETWKVPDSITDKMTKGMETLNALVQKCKSPTGSPADREMRDALLSELVIFARQGVRNWAYGRYFDGVLTRKDIHAMGFLLVGETSGNRERAEPTRALASVKVGILDANSIFVIIDQAALENAALSKGGWPRGVHEALIVIIAADGVTEVVRKMTRTLHNEILMPEGSRGKIFIIKASFMKHPDDEPHFGNSPTFAMPLTTEDLAASVRK
jgi:hypothetical protein